MTISADSSTRSAADTLAWSRTVIEPALRSAVDQLDSRLRHIAGYHLGWWDENGVPVRSSAGKAIRPTLVLLSARAAGGNATDAVPAAVAVELAHNYSVIHDDVIDGDETRRHRRTVWRVFGVGKAILAGDARIALALEALAEGGHQAAASARTLNQAVQELLAGQSNDLAFEHRNDVTLQECERMASRKTGALFGCACALGAMAGDGDRGQVEHLRAFGRHFGIAFHLVDDLLGIWGDPAVTGKPVFSDLASRKKTLPIIAAQTSGTPAGVELAARYRDERADLTALADLVERAGGREWAQSQADVQLDLALHQLRLAAPRPEPATELTAIARLATRRER